MSLIPIAFLAVFSLFACMFVLAKLKDQRGEVVPDEDPSGEVPDEDPSGDDFSLEDDDYLTALEQDIQIGEEEEEQGKKEKKDTKAEEDEEKEKELTPKQIQKQLEDDLKDRQGKLDDLNKAIAQANKLLHETRTKKNELKQDEPALNDQQLLALFQEHQDEPETLFNLVKYMVDQGAQKKADETLDAAEISKTKKEIDQGLYEAFPDLVKEDSQLRSMVNTTKGNLRLNDHPFGDFLSVSAMIHRDLEEIKNAEYERGKAEATGEVAEGKRKESIKANQLGPAGKKGAKAENKISSSQVDDVAKRIGLSNRGKKVYTQLINKKTQTAEV